MKRLWLFGGKVAYLLALPVMKALPSLFEAPRVRVVLKTPEGQLLLVKTWFGAQRWSFPGGGIARGETPELAALREVQEETGILVDPEQLRRIGEVTVSEGIGMTLLMFEADVAVASLPKLDWHRTLEIADRKWWLPQEETETLGASVRWYLQR